MMNCTTFAQQIGATPGQPDDAMRAHMDDCASCTRLQAELSDFDATISAALDVVVPAGLGKLPAQETSNVVPLSHAEKTGKRSVSKPMFALAATMLLSVGVLFGSWLGRVSAPLPETVVAHVLHEPNLLRGDWSVVPVAQLNTVLTDGNVSLNGDIGTVRHAGLCLFRGNKVAHVVVQSTNGPVTVMLLPNEKTDGIMTFNEEGFRGVLIPVGEGSIAVISDNEKATDEVRNTITDKVVWSI